MACPGPNSVSFSIAAPGDRVTVWIDNCSPVYFLVGWRIVTHSAGVDSVKIHESQLDPASPITYYYQKGEALTVSLYFDPSMSTKGKSCEVHGRVTGTDGKVKKEWCHLVKSGTAAQDMASFSVKGK